MRETLSKKETPVIIGVGLIIGIIAVALVYFGNPANMGFCIACFLRDTGRCPGLSFCSSGTVHTSGNRGTGSGILHSGTCYQRV